jgi:hypothetical protein
VEKCCLERVKATKPVKIRFQSALIISTTGDPVGIGGGFGTFVNIGKFNKIIIVGGTITV